MNEINLSKHASKLVQKLDEWLREANTHTDTSITIHKVIALIVMMDIPEARLSQFRVNVDEGKIVFVSEGVETPN